MRVLEERSVQKPMSKEIRLSFLDVHHNQLAMSTTRFHQFRRVLLEICRRNLRASIRWLYAISCSQLLHQFGWLHDRTQLLKHAYVWNFGFGSSDMETLKLQMQQEAIKASIKKRCRGMQPQTYVRNWGLPRRYSRDLSARWSGISWTVCQGNEPKPDIFRGFRV